MSELRKANTSSAYFITCTLVGWLNLFCHNRYCDIIIESLEYCRNHKQLEIYAYVIMPSHLHLILRHYDENLNGILRDFKGHTAKEIYKQILMENRQIRKNMLLNFIKNTAKSKLNQRYQIWQKTNYPIELDYDRIFDQKLNYIHKNPLKAGIVNDESAYLYSSANPDSPLKVDLY